ncbi:MAG TPA: hypothetical protein VMW24_07515 [Sedimentisphaerales bacterium]|nr:hypothetical protein [Sedimentisphaerales bacterium]
MNDQKRENLKELVEKFFGAGQAESCLQDFQEAERILREHPAPRPDDMLISNIKAEIAMRLPARRARIFRHRVWEAAGVAAAVAIVAFLGVRLSQQPDRQHSFHASLLPTAIWESNNIVADDVDLAVFTAEIEQIRSEVAALESGEDTADPDSAIAELEMELVELNSDFWKG